MKKVAELTVDEFREIVREVVFEVLAEQQDDYEGGVAPRVRRRAQQEQEFG